MHGLFRRLAVIVPGRPQSVGLVTLVRRVGQRAELVQIAADPLVEFSDPLVELRPEHEVAVARRHEIGHQVSLELDHLPGGLAEDTERFGHLGLVLHAFTHRAEQEPPTRAEVREQEPGDAEEPDHFPAETERHTSPS